VVFSLHPSAFSLSVLSGWMSREPNSKSHATAWVTALLAVIVLYLLSVGPVTYYNERSAPGTTFRAWANSYVTPYFWLLDGFRYHVMFSPLADLLDDYFDLWSSRRLNG